MSAQYTQIIFLFVMVAAFYFLLIRPQQQRQKQHNSMVSSLEPGVEIVTIGGIFGTIVSIGDSRIRLRIADGSELEISKRAIGSIVPAETPFDAIAAPYDEASDDEDALNA